MNDKTNCIIDIDDAIDFVKRLLYWLVLLLQQWCWYVEWYWLKTTIRLIESISKMQSTSKTTTLVGWLVLLTDRCWYWYWAGIGTLVNNNDYGIMI